MYNSYQIANYFIKSSLATGQELTPMKLIKLSYIAHGWHLGLYDTELLDEAICAWKFGPVISSIYHDFKKYGNSQITELYNDYSEFGYGAGYGQPQYPMPDEKIKPFLDEIWKVYGKYSGIQLSSMTHQPGTPWYTVWHKLGGNSSLGAIIPNDLIKEHYKEKLKVANGESRREAATA